MDQITFYEAKLQYEIDSWDLHEATKNNMPIIVIDTRSTESYGIEHIPSAMSLPHRLISEESTKALDKEKTYVTYCDGIGCNASTKGALKLAKLGFTVKELQGGLEWWKRDGHPTEGENSSQDKSARCGC